MRLAKYLAHAGIASRRAAERLIAEGRVTLGGRPVLDPATDVGEEDDIAVDGERVRGAESHLVYALNKPAGVVSTAHDPQGRRIVTALVATRARLYPVGRLDADTTGLILLTNDGELAHRLTHPRFGVGKTYRATVARPPVGDRALRALRHGVTLDDGPTAPARARRLAPDTVELTIREGRKRQVRRMLEAVGHPVRRLERIAFGPLALGSLGPGEHRRLAATEVERLRRAAEDGPREPGGGGGRRRQARGRPSRRR
jgi:23S rRNA pseudouridine2605 synthase